jgi:hypothetical protein
MSERFRVFPQLNDPALQTLVGTSGRIDHRSLPYFSSERLPDKVVRALAEARAIPLKEVFESFEFFERVRRRVRAKVMVDLCCGHGLTGMLYALFEPTVERVILLDKRRPESTAVLIDALSGVVPRVRERVEFLELPLKAAREHLPEGAAMVAVHACGDRTDACIELAIALKGSIGLMPCCYTRRAAGAPETLVTHLGQGMAADIQRTYRLQGAGYRVDWSSIPTAVTPMARVIVGRAPQGVLVEEVET